ncbi:hypothetical protein K8I61_12730 [bacterium]|nr:hypothetical protein [bacterium]
MSARDDMRVALWGLGRAAERWIAAYKTAGVAVVGAGDPGDALDEFAATHGLARRFASVEEIIDDESIGLVEIDIPAPQAVKAASLLLEAGVPVGLRASAVTSEADAQALEEARKRRVPLRLHSPVFYATPAERARDDLDRDAIGDVQTLFARAIATATIGVASAWEDVFDALPLMHLIGPVRSLHVTHGRDDAMLIAWASNIERGAGRFGCFEAIVRARPPLDASALAAYATTPATEAAINPAPDISFEVSGTDGYLFGAHLAGGEGRAPYSRYIRGTLDAPLGDLPLGVEAMFAASAADIVRAVRARTAPRFGIEWAHEIGRIRSAINASRESGQEVLIEPD